MKTNTEKKERIQYNKIRLGMVDNENIYLSPPSWDCGWYWGYGYLGNRNCHYHIDGISKDKNLFDGLKEHFGESFIVKDEADIWTLAELFQSFYTLKESAEFFGRGGSHYTNNPCKKLLTNKKLVNRINEILLPEIFKEIYKILNKYVTE